MLFRSPELSVIGVRILWLVSIIGALNVMALGKDADAATWNRRHLYGYHVGDRILGATRRWPRVKVGCRP